MKLLWRIAKEARNYRLLLSLGAIAAMLLTVVNLITPRLLARMTGIVQRGMEDLGGIRNLVFALVALYLLRVLFRFLASYLPHKAAWNLVRDLRMIVYNRIQSFSISFFHKRQTGDLMSRVVNDTATFEQLYAHVIPETITNVLTLVGVMVI